MDINPLQIEISTDLLSPEFRKKLKEALEAYPGETPLSLFLIDPVKQYRIAFKTKKYRVTDCTALRNGLSSIGAVCINR